MTPSTRAPAAASESRWRRGCHSHRPTARSRHMATIQLMTGIRRASAGPKCRNGGRSTCSASGGGPSTKGPRKSELAVGDPAAMESERYPLGERHRGDGRGGEVTGVEDHEIAAVAAGVVDVGQHVAVVLPGIAGGGHEDALARGAARP